MITSVEITNLRSIKHLKAPIAPLTVLVGENGSGKSSVIRGLQFATGWARRLESTDETATFSQRERSGWRYHTTDASLPYYEWSRVGSDQLPASARVVVSSSSPDSRGSLDVFMYPLDFGDPGGPGTTCSVRTETGSASSLVSALARTRFAPIDRVTWSPPVDEPYPSFFGQWVEDIASLPFPTVSELARPGLSPHLDYPWATFRGALAAVARSRRKSRELRMRSQNLFGVDWTPALSKRQAPMSGRAISKARKPSDVSLRGFYEDWLTANIPSYLNDPETIRSLEGLLSPLSVARQTSQVRRFRRLLLAMIAYTKLREDLSAMGAADREIIEGFWAERHSRESVDILTPFDLESLGTWQFFPVMTHLIAADTGETLITEEPEVSLHPKAQVAIGEWFADQVAEGKQLIFSTHSHYLLLGLCKKVREGVIRPGDVAILDCKKGRNGTAIIRRKIDAEGRIEGWIPSFLEVDDYLFHQWFGTSAEATN